jgi:tetratricopeptide (TPR) repeat protein
MASRRVVVLFAWAALYACAEDAPVNPDGTAWDNSGAAPTPPPVREKGDASKLLSQGEREFREKNHDAAVRFFSEALAATDAPALRVRVLYARHKAFVSLARVPSAIADLTAALELEPQHVMALLMRGNLNLLTGSCRAAESDYARVLAMDPAKRDALARQPHAAECRSALERAEYARRANQPHAIRVALGEAMADGRATAASGLLLERAEVSLQIGGEGDVEDALADLAKVIKMDANNVKAYALRGRALLKHGDYPTGARCARSDTRSRCH